VTKSFVFMLKKLLDLLQSTSLPQEQTNVCWSKIVPLGHMKLQL